MTSIPRKWPSGARSRGKGKRKRGEREHKEGRTEGNPAWQPLAADQSLLFYVYGTHTTPGPLGSRDRDYLTGIQIEIQTSNQESSEFKTTVTVLHAPEIDL